MAVATQMVERKLCRSHEQAEIAHAETALMAQDMEVEMKEVVEEMDSGAHLMSLQLMVQLGSVESSESHWESLGSVESWPSAAAHLMSLQLMVMTLCH